MTEQVSADHSPTAVLSWWQAVGQWLVSVLLNGSAESSIPGKWRLALSYLSHALWVGGACAVLVSNVHCTCSLVVLT